MSNAPKETVAEHIEYLKAFIERNQTYADYIADMEEPVNSILKTTAEFALSEKKKAEDRLQFLINNPDYISPY